MKIIKSVEGRVIMLTIEQLEELRGFDSATICNAIEMFNIRPRNEGFLPATIKSIFKYDKPFIGYASTAKFSTAAPAKKSVSLEGYYRHIQNTPRPSISVIEDIDPVPCGALWGEVNAHVHMALGSIGTVTNGGVRDLKQIYPTGFGLFAKDIMVSHAYIHVEDYNCPVNVGGVIIKPGDLLFCDSEGVVVIPEEIAPLLADACRKIATAELPVLENVKRALLEGKEIDVSDLMNWAAEMAKLRQAK
jgi:4-hydroxy-4-methyl-2-oxoglutarate aldolase